MAISSIYYYYYYYYCKVAIYGGCDIYMLLFSFFKNSQKNWKLKKNEEGGFYCWLAFYFSFNFCRLAVDNNDDDADMLLLYGNYCS